MKSAAQIAHFLPADISANADAGRWRDCYEQDGAIIVRGLLSEEARYGVFAALNDRVAMLEAQLNPQSATAPGADIQEVSERIQALERSEPGIQGALYDAMTAAPAVYRAALDEALMGVVQQLLSPDVALHPKVILLMSMPQDAWHLPLWHQDWYYNEGPWSTVTAYAPLVPVREDNGSLLLALGEAGGGLLPHGDFDHGQSTKWHTIDPACTEQFGRVAELSLEPGDVLLFNSLVPHSARLNRSDDIRFVLNFRYRDLRDRKFAAQRWRIGAIKHAREALGRDAPPRNS